MDKLIHMINFKNDHLAVCGWVKGWLTKPWKWKNDNDQEENDIQSGTQFWC